MDIAEYIRRRNKLLLSAYDYEAMVALMRSAGSTPPDAVMGEVVFHKARTAWAGCPRALRAESERWLKDRGYRVLGQ